MNKIMINIDLIKKITNFLKKTKSLRYLNPYIFDNIDIYKEINDIDFIDYYLKYINSLPRLDFNNVIKISREVYQLYGKEKDFDNILESLINNCSVDVGTLNREDNNCITNANEDRVLLSGTYYDVILLCHEIGHKLKNNSSINSDNIMKSILFETPSIIVEFTANNYLRDKYNVDLNAEELRKIHILSKKKEDNIENRIFFIIIGLIKDRKLNIANLYMEFIKNISIIEYLNNQDTSIEECIDEGISNYSYDIGFILGKYVNNSENKKELLNMFLKYKNDGINIPFTIEENIIKESLENKIYTTK